MRIVLINQARMTSTRLPGKVMLPIMGKPMLHYQMERLKRAKGIDEIVIATTDGASDLPIVNFCETEQIAYFRGSEHDVLKRYYDCAKAHAADAVIRVTSDCPLIDPQLMSDVIDCYRSHPDAMDYASNIVQRTFPRGMDTEILSFKTLKFLHESVHEMRYREHVTLFALKHAKDFRLKSITQNEDLSRFQWSVDTPADFALIEKVLEALYPDNPEFTMNDVANYCLALEENK